MRNELVIRLKVKQPKKKSLFQVQDDVKYCSREGNAGLFVYLLMSGMGKGIGRQATDALRVGHHLLWLSDGLGRGDREGLEQLLLVGDATHCARWSRMH